MATPARLALSRRNHHSLTVDLRLVLFDRFVVDFYCHAAKLPIELDGKQHEWFADSDADRMRILERPGIGVTPFANTESKATSIRF